MQIKYPVAIISNKNSKKNRLEILTKEDIHSVFSDDQAFYYWTDNKKDLENVLKELAEKSVELIFSNGGDGTHRALIEYLINNLPDYKPVIVPLRGGTLNMIADNLYVSYVTYDVLKAVKTGIENYRDFEIVEKRVLKVQTDTFTKYGFVFLAGAVYKALKLYYKYPEGGIGSVTRALSSTMFGWLIRKPRLLTISRPVQSTTSVDGKIISFPYLVAIVSTLPRLIMSFHPFVGPKRYKKLLVMLDGQSMLKNYNLFKFFRVSHKEVWNEKRVVSVASNVEIDVKEGFSIDGEMFKLHKTERIIITEGPRIRFLAGERWHML